MLGDDPLPLAADKEANELCKLRINFATLPARQNQIDRAAQWITVSADSCEARCHERAARFDRDRHCARAGRQVPEPGNGDSLGIGGHPLGRGCFDTRCGKFGAPGAALEDTISHHRRSGRVFIEPARAANEVDRANRLAGQLRSGAHGAGTWATADISTLATAASLAAVAADTTKSRRALYNRRTLNGAGLFTLYADDAVTPLYVATVTDVTGGANTVSAGEPARTTALV